MLTKTFENTLNMAFLVIPEGFEPSTYCLEGSCSIQLSYGTKISFLQKTYQKVGVAGFEPATSCSQSRRDNRATLHPEKLWRRVRDSNPWYSFPYACLANMSFRPLRQLSNLKERNSFKRLQM
jgi:hypothetical protein